MRQRTPSSGALLRATESENHLGNTPDLSALKAPRPPGRSLNTSESLVSEFGVDTLTLRSKDIFYDEALRRFHETTMTKATPRFAEVDKLHQVLDTTSTVFGKMSLFRHLVRPSTSLTDIMQRQEAIKELTENKALREQVQQFVDSCIIGHQKGDTSRQDKILELLGGQRTRAEPNFLFFVKSTFKAAFNAGRTCSDPLSQIGKICEASRSMGTSESRHIKNILAIFDEAQQCHHFPVFRGDVCLTPLTIGARSEIHHAVPVWSFTAKPIDSEQLALGALFSIGYGFLLMQGHLLSEFVRSTLTLTLGFASLLVGLGRMSLSPTMVLHRARTMLLKTEPLLKVLDAVGELDSLLALVRFNERHQDCNTWPELFEGDRYHLQAEGLRAPFIHDRSNCVPNNVLLTGGRPLIITGSNSAGKSTFLNAVSHNQILAQIGTKVLATRFRASVCDHFSYQGPDSAALSSEGRFGMEMLETKKSFERSSPQSLVVLDEVAGGTATEESRDIAEWIIHEGLRELGCGAAMVTHDHELARRLHALGGVDCVKLELEDELPTYLVQSGIASSSRPDRVLKSIEFTRQDMKRMLQEKRKDRGSEQTRHMS